MILKGNQRSGARQLAMHLINAQDNDHVTVHELRDFVGRDLMDAFNEAYALSRGTKCRQYLFSLSLNPPETETVPVAVFEQAIDAIERKLGLGGQPRAIVLHEKNGRRHAHCVWSRIDVKTMTAINLPHYKIKLREMSRALYLEHGWKLPRGLINSAERDPLNFTLDEWQKAKRLKRDPRAIKTAFRDAWATSGSGAAFAQALASRGYYLARGDRKSFVAVDLNGEVFAVARWAGLRTKEVNALLGNPAAHPSVDEVSAKLAARVSERLRSLLDEAEHRHAEVARALEQKRRRLVMAQRDERARFERQQAERRAREHQARMDRFPSGLKGLWSRLIGDHKKIKTVNESEARESDERDRREKEALISRQLQARRRLQEEFRRSRGRDTVELRRLYREIERSVPKRALLKRALPETVDQRRNRRHSML